MTDERRLGEWTRDEQAERAIALQVLRDDHPEQWTRAELEAEIRDRDAQAIADAAGGRGRRDPRRRARAGVRVRVALGCARPGVDLMPGEIRRESGVWALCFRACGARQYQTLGTAEEGWTRQRAEQALRHVMADVERGTWSPRHPEPASEANPDPSFHEFTSEWFEATKGEWREKTRLDYEWQLAHHLLPFFRDHRRGNSTGTRRQREATTRRAARCTGARSWRPSCSPACAYSTRPWNERMRS
jgi:hypothetical protein